MAQCDKMLEALRQSGGVGLTRAQFAELLGIKKGPHLTGLINELVTRNLALVETQIFPKGFTGYVYKPTEKAV